MTLCLCLGLSVPQAQARNNSLTDNQPKVSLRQEEEIARYFADRIAGKEGTFDQTERIKKANVAKYQQAVWQLWQKANAASNEEKLPRLRPLQEASTGSWKLPEELEPHATLPFYWGSKSDNGTQPYPLFIYLHGSGSKNAEWRTGLKLCQRFDDAPSAYFIPQIPNTGDYYRWWQKAKQYAWEKLLRLALASGEVDPNRVFFFGISEGGYGSQRLASFYADYLAGAGPMAGGEPLKNAPAENCANIAFSLRTGAIDYGFFRNKLTGYTREAFDSLAAKHPQQYKHHIELVPGRGHAIDYSPTTPWLKEFTRNPYPKDVYWEDFEMDGVHRRGFYNIAVAERPDKDLRTYYEMHIEGNEIDLRVSNVAYTTTEAQSGIELKFSRSYTPATSGKFTIYLCPELVDLNKKVTLRVNGKQVFKGKVKADLKNMVNSCATFYDPCRVYPAAIEVDLSN